MALKTACWGQRLCTVSLVFLFIYSIGSALELLFELAGRLAIRSDSNDVWKIQYLRDTSAIINYWSLFFMTIGCLVFIATIVCIVLEKRTAMLLLIVTMLIITLSFFVTIYALFRLNFDIGLRNELVQIAVKTYDPKIFEEKKKELLLVVDFALQIWIIQQNVKLIVGALFKVYSLLVFYSHYSRITRYICWKGVCDKTHRSLITPAYLISTYSKYEDELSKTY
ncbi:uncharacterized protein LOC135834611 isoform X2 [Planococcus citri]|uniref:uncharacterized protein LOC135834611 isoform X2 n=1 Tax=Planococcus citri TaxID=170843 RepID=UPI0031F8542E